VDPSDDDDRRLIERLHDALASEPYHVFLGVDRDAAGDALREAFHARARRLHPDRWAADPELGPRAYDVYKRITEAYRVLSNPQTRKQYLDGGAIRLDTTDRPAVRRPEEAVQHPTARKYYVMALEAERRKDERNVKLNLQLALQLEPDNPVLLEKLEKHK
jgi:curved DNA-binding protein CbpA